jgi:hypothetical protein
MDYCKFHEKERERPTGKKGRAARERGKGGGGRRGVQ